MWQILHKCNPGQEPQNYAILQKWTDDSPRRPITQIMCPGQCREEFFILDHDFFEEAQHMKDSQSSRLPPGFVIPHAKVPG